MATPPISKATVQEAVDAVIQHGSKAAAARALGIPKTTLKDRCAKADAYGVASPQCASSDKSPADKDGELFAIDQSQNSTHIHSKSLKVKTVAEAIEKAGVDLSVWAIERFLINSWEVGTKNKDTGAVTVTPLWQVKVWLKRKIPAIVEIAGESLLKRIAAHAPKYKPQFRKSRRKDAHLLELSLYDCHFGKRCWDRETGNNQDLDTISTVFAEAVDECIDKTGGYHIERILLPVGNDFLHINNPQATTAKGTPQDVDDRLSKIFETGTDAMIKAIDRCLGVAPVELLFVQGNHDLNSSWFLIKILEAWYRNCKHVTVDTSPRQRKFRAYGPVLLGFTHGNEEPHRDLPTIMAGEVPEMWAASKCREWHLGHLHKKKQTNYSACDTYGGVIVRTLPSLSATDRWHYSKGYINSRRAAEAYLYGLQDGPVGYFSANVKS